MEQKLFKTVNSSGIANLVSGIVAAAAGAACIAVGVLTIVNGVRLMSAGKSITF